jgi:hypothetical protein
MLLTSTWKVLAPSVEDVIPSFLHHLLQFRHLTGGKPIIPRQINRRFHPEFRFPLRTVCMDMRARFLTGEEEEPIPLPLEYGWTHRETLHGPVYLFNLY